MDQHDKSNVVLIKETLSHIDSVIVSVVYVHFEALGLQLVHHLDLLLHKRRSSRAQTKVYGALLLSKLVFGLKVDDSRGDSTAIECDSDAWRGILLHFKPLEVRHIVVETTSNSQSTILLWLRLFEVHTED